jgi:hypothetical protein
VPVDTPSFSAPSVTSASRRGETQRPVARHRLEAPYRVDVTDRLKPGDNANALEIAVTNQWSNRIAGDARVEPAQRVLNAPTGGRFGGPPREPLPSGLLGPVTILSAGAATSR